MNKVKSVKSLRIAQDMLEQISAKRTYWNYNFKNESKTAKKINPTVSQRDLEKLP